MRIFLLTLFLSALSACSTNYPNKQISGQYFPSVSGQTLEKNKINIPKDFKNKTTLLLLGYTQNSQFDIDRWLIALDMTKTNVATYEIPTIQGLFPRMFSTTIDNGMRSGIPKSLWKGVVTVYKDGGIIQAFTGNDAPNNARVILINTNGKIIYFYDQGFSVDALNNLRDSLQTNG
jgi:cytochrome oxidase Cu insertion factor (SCO1/SenC/PrrC family)